MVRPSCAAVPASCLRDIVFCKGLSNNASISTCPTAAVALCLAWITYILVHTRNPQVLLSCGIWLCSANMRCPWLNQCFVHVCFLNEFHPGHCAKVSNQPNTQPFQMCWRVGVLQGFSVWWSSTKYAPQQVLTCKRRTFRDGGCCSVPAVVRTPQSDCKNGRPLDFLAYDNFFRCFMAAQCRQLLRHNA